MKFTIFGASGFIGASLADALRRGGHDCRTPARGATSALTRPLGHVIYCSGVTSDYRRRPLDAMEAHVAGLLPILRHARFDSFLYLSSTRVYHRADAATEDAEIPVRPQEPEDLYALSKLAGEAVCLAIPRQKVRVVRLSNIYGPQDRSENFLNSVVDEALSSGKVVFRTSPSSVKDYLSIRDVVDVLPRIAVRGRRRVYNVASGVNTTNAEVARVLGGLVGCRTSFATRAVRLTFPRISVRRIEEELAFMPRRFSAELAHLIETRRTDRAYGRPRGQHQ